MVTAFDVKHGKPHPEPYLMALEKGGFNVNEAIVIENAPLGVQAGIAAGIFTIAVNTGRWITKYYWMPAQMLCILPCKLFVMDGPPLPTAYKEIKKQIKSANEL